MLKSFNPLSKTQPKRIATRYYADFGITSSSHLSFDMLDRLLRLLVLVFAFVIVAIAGQYWTGRNYYPLVVVDATDNLTLTFLQRPTSDGEACEALATTIGSLMRANCATCKVTRQQCLRNLSPNLRDLLSGKPLPYASAQILNGFIAYTHPNPKTALAACMESQRQAVSNGQRGQLICTAPDTPRFSSQTRFELAEAAKTGFGYVAQTFVIFGIGIAFFLAIQMFSVRSPTDAVGINNTPAIAFKTSNLIKRIVDILTSVTLLTLLFPILVLASALIFVLEGHPIFYISRRYISLDQCVSILKFRTMVKDATSPKYQLRERFMRDGYLDIPLTCEVYTPIGRFLERTQLVEILQLFNILFHGMSLIGNRPLPRENIELLKQFNGWEKRFDSPAGISGLSQIVGKLNQNPQERLALESSYAAVFRSPSGNILLLDFLIAYHTIRLLLLGKPLSIDGAKRLVLVASGK